LYIAEGYEKTICTSIVHFKRWAVLEPVCFLESPTLKKKNIVLHLINFSTTPLLDNLGPLIANLNSEFANFIMCGNFLKATFSLKDEQEG